MSLLLQTRLNAFWLLIIAVMSLACVDRSPGVTPTLVQDQSEAMIAVLDTLHTLIGRESRIIFRERALVFDTVHGARMATQNHSSVTTAAIEVREHIELEACTDEFCDIPDSGATGKPVQMISCSIPQPANGGLEVYCRLLTNMFGEIQVSSAYVLVAARQGGWRVQQLVGYADM